jgi:hypothetical protein
LVSEPRSLFQEGCFDALKLFVNTFDQHKNSPEQLIFTFYLAIPIDLHVHIYSTAKEE